ncbi:uncharacterized protein [Palaemon carinicauda]|uniref:uncharacterized protein n=1 Tax=Palaemon carinicauda TaxID=392227 RepID=UPI0035B5C847
MLEANMPLAKWTANGPVSGDFSKMGPQYYLGLDWNTADDTLAVKLRSERIAELIRELSAILRKYKGLENIKVPRNAHQGHQASLHVFADASKQAFGVASYVITAEGKCQLLTVKARVTPKRMLELDESQSITKLELTTLLFGCRLVKYLIKLRPETYVSTTMWFDASMTLHVPKSCNPADLASRGVAAKVILKSNLWLHGPVWLADISAYPDQSRFPSEWEIKACPIRRLPPQTGRFAHFPSLDEVGGSYPQILRPLQGKSILLMFNEHAFIGQWNPYIDNNGVLRGRSCLSDAPTESGYMDPVFLESHCSFWRLIVENWHEVLLYYNTSTLFVPLLKEFWVPRMRQQMKNILKRCIHCKRVQGQPYPTLPLDPVHPNRLNAEVPFRVTGLDYIGGFKVHRSHVDMVYVLLFTCPAMRAVALDFTTSLTVVELVQAIRRFAARFGMPCVQQCLNLSSWSNTLDRPHATPCYQRVQTGPQPHLEVLQEVKCVVNDRPLTYLDVDNPNDAPLTPSHLLYGRTLSLAPQVHLADLTDPAFREGDILRNDNQKLTKMLQTFLKRLK